jgi:hypothetical protein
VYFVVGVFVRFQVRRFNNVTRCCRMICLATKPKHAIPPATNFYRYLLPVFQHGVSQTLSLASIAWADW